MSECVPLKGPIHFRVRQLMYFREQTLRNETILWTERQLNAWMQWYSRVRGRVSNRFSFFYPRGLKSPLSLQTKGTYPHSALSLQWYMRFHWFLPCTFLLLIGTWMWEQRFVVHPPQWVIVCTGSGMAEGKTPAGMNSSAAVSAGVLSKTDNVTFQCVCASIAVLQRSWAKYSKFGSGNWG